MNFFNHYSKISNSLKKRELRNKIISECKIQHSTFYSWISRKKIPPLAQKVISELLNISQNELFPKDNLSN